MFLYISRNYTHLELLVFISYFDQSSSLLNYSKLWTFLVVLISTEEIRYVVILLHIDSLLTASKISQTSRRKTSCSNSNTF